MTRALIVIDVQESFRQRPLWQAISNPHIADDVARLVDGVRASDDLVVWVLHTEPGTGGTFDPTSGHVRFIGPLAPRDGESLGGRGQENFDLRAQGIVAAAYGATHLLADSAEVTGAPAGTRNGTLTLPGVPIPVISASEWAYDPHSEVWRPLALIEPGAEQGELTASKLGALLDSGAGTSIINKSDAARLGVTPETPGVVAVGSARGMGQKSIDSWLGPFETVDIGGEIIRNSSIRFAELLTDAAFAARGSRIATHSETQQPMLLGVDVLRAHRMLVSHSQRKIYFTYVGGAVFQ